jgi:hypothetical protein
MPAVQFHLVFGLPESKEIQADNHGDENTGVESVSEIHQTQGSAGDLFAK